MIAPWASEYVGIPYRFGGMGRDGADCWGLARLILRERFGKVLPDFAHEGAGKEALAAIVDGAIPLLRAERIPAPEVGDLVLVRIGHPCHVGVMVGDGYMIHTLARHDSALERYQGPRWAPRLEGFYRV